MIEELTPQIIASSLLLIIVIAPILTLLLSTLLLWGYRRAVARAMGTAGEFEAWAPGTPTEHAAPTPPPLAAVSDPTDLYRVAIGGPRHYLICYVVAGLAYAAIFALAARFAYPLRSDLPGFLIGVWIYAWPIVLALPLIVPGRARSWSIGIVAYLVAFLPLGLWAVWIPDIPSLRYGGIDLPARSSMAPAPMIGLWFTVNGPPTLLMLVCLTRRVRAVAPLVLALVTTVVSGSWFALITLFSRQGAHAAVAVAAWLGVHVDWMVAATIVISLAGFSALGWALARGITGAYRRRKLSEQSLLLDALWLLFATWYAMWLVLGGLKWAATALVALLAFKLILAAARRPEARTVKATRDLTFLRVFSLGRRSDALLDGVAKYWRHIGSVQMITGPDVALSTVQPHQFLDFLSGKLGRHFVRDQVSLERSLAERDRARDPDGRFRINNFFCHADSWQPALPRLVEEGEAVLMDLRSFSAMHAGCIHELQQLVQNVPLDRCLLVVDDSTDGPFLKRTLKEAWEELSPASPNHRRSPEEATTHRFEPGTGALRRLLLRLCEASAK
jgi:hypothetical protein